MPPKLRLLWLCDTAGSDLLMGDTARVFSWLGLVEGPHRPASRAAGHAFGDAGSLEPSVADGGMVPDRTSVPLVDRPGCVPRRSSGGRPAARPLAAGRKQGEWHDALPPTRRQRGRSLRDLARFLA